MTAPQADPIGSGEVPARKEREPQTEQQISERAEQQDRERIEQVSAEDRSVDAAIQRSIKLHGA